MDYTLTLTARTALVHMYRVTALDGQSLGYVWETGGRWGGGVGAGKDLPDTYHNEHGAAEALVAGRR